MKKLLLILLFVPLIFSCGDNKKDKKKREAAREQDIEGYWEVTFLGRDEPDLIFHFAEDGFFCSDVNIGSSCRDNRDKINNCDDCMSDNNWKYTNDEETQIIIKAGKRKKDQRLMKIDIEKETENKYILNSGEMILERTSLENIKEEYEEKKKKREEKRRIIEEEKKQEETESYVEYEETELTEEESDYYGVINDPDGYTNVREEKSSKSEIVFKVYEGDEFEIIDDSDDNWWMIEYNGKQGYIYRSKIDIFKKHL